MQEQNPLMMLAIKTATGHKLHPLPDVSKLVGPIEYQALGPEGFSTPQRVFNVEVTYQQISRGKA